MTWAILPDKQKIFLIEKALNALRSLETSGKLWQILFFVGHDTRNVLTELFEDRVLIWANHKALTHDIAFVNRFFDWEVCTLRHSRPEDCDNSAKDRFLRGS